MRKRFTLLIALLALTVSAWATPTTITWNAGNGLSSIYLSEYTNLYWDESYHSYNDGPKVTTIEGIAATISATTDGSSASFSTYNNSTDLSASNGATLTFSSSLYEIQSIVINFTSSGYATGWTSNGSTLTWTGSATHSVEMTNAYVNGITSIVFTVEAIPTTTVEWDGTDVSMVSLSCSNVDEVQTASEIDGITASLTKISAGDPCQFSGSEIWFSNACGKVTFTSSVGNIISIVITCGTVWNHYDLSGGWTFNGEANTLTWEGTASNEVILSGGIDFMVSSIEFIIDASAPAPVVTTTTVTWDTEEVSSISLNCENVDDVATSEEIDGITASLRRIASGGNCSFTNRDLWMNNNSGELTFTASVGNISGIVITSDHIYTEPYNLPAGWTYDSEATTLTWVGAASNQVTLSGNMDFNVSSVEFTVESAAAPVDPTPVSQGPVTWDFANDEELANLSLTEFENYYFSYSSTYGSEHNGPKAIDLKDIVATISATTDGAYASFSDNNNNSIILEAGGTLTFSTELGQFQSIVVNTNGGSGRTSGDWTWDLTEKTLTWAGTPANSVVLDDIYVSNITSIVFTFVSAAPAFTADITWDATEVATVSLYGGSFNTVVPGTAIDGIKPSIMKTNDGYCYFDNSKIKMQNNGELIFTSSVGDIQGIVLTFDNTDYSISDFPVGWTLDEGAGTLTWTGTAAEEVSLSGNISCTVSSIEFDVIEAPAPVYPTPSGPSFIWQSRQVSHVLLSIDDNGASQTTHVIKNIITSLQRTAAKTDQYDFCLFANNGINIKNNGTLTFRSIVGDLTGIVITCGYKYYADDLSADWRYDSENGTLIWVGTPAETVTLSGHVDVANISSIEFFYDPAPAPRKGETFFGIYNQYYQITGAHTAKLPAQDLNHTLQIPEYVDDEDVRYYVTEIDDYAFYGQAELPNVFGGVNIAKIGAHAFDGCLQITDISWYSDVLDTIGDAAFKDCKLMANFDCMTQLPPVLGSNAFSGTTYLNRIRVNSASDYKYATNWEDYADKIYSMWEAPAIGEEFFWHNQMTTNWYAVSSVSPVKEAKVLPYSAAVNDIYPATRYGRLVIPEEITYLYQEYKVTGIGENAYKDSTRFYMVMIPQAVKSIESGAFLNCTGVETVQFLWDDPRGTVTWADANVGAEFKTAASGETKICVPKGTLAYYQEWAPAWAECMVEGEILDIDVTASEDPNHASRYYRTFYDSETDYLMPPSVWAHAGYVENGTFILSPVAFDGMVLPRGTAVVLESETPTYRLVPTGNTAPLYDGRNDLVGTDVDIPRTSVGNNGENVYVLNRQANIGGNLYVGMGMYQYTGATLGAHKAYLIYDAPSGPNNAPARFVFKHKNEPTDVENVQSDKVQCTKVIRDGQLIIIKDGKEYNAQGQKLH